MLSLKSLKVLPIFFSLLFLLSSHCWAQIVSEGYKVTGYYLGWTPAYLAWKDVPAQNYDVIYYAFAAPKFPADGSFECNPDNHCDNLTSISVLKQKNPNLKVLLSIGGWDDKHYNSYAFGAIAADPVLRSKFVENVKDLFKPDKYPDLDGVDIDWESPVQSTDDFKNFVELMKALRTALPTKTFSIACYPTFSQCFSNNKEEAKENAKKMLEAIDWINIMDYDFPFTDQSSRSRTNNSSALSQLDSDPHCPPLASSPPYDCVKGNMQTYIDNLEDDPSKLKQLLMGIPLYGFVWQGVEPGPASSHPGLYQQASGFLPSPGRTNGNFRYADMPSVVLSNGLAQFKDWEKSFTTYYGFGSRIFASFNDPLQVQAKVKYIKEHGLGGGMIWSLPSDTFDQNSLGYILCLGLRTDPMSCTVPQKSAGAH